ncbi:hypothetical protein [Thermomonospora umbrina]|uniref:Uncharacterized protein n=1 Tax=Thermomonospora umbrina TaxID=111806 RepID=A0A3D9STH5_9ACTN|nr:hypothetical protein [Thermomonospora umbrina]REE95011.1 hypothetical protein DFJ69_0381 [Thermomonospora umbrina]
MNHQVDKPIVEAVEQIRDRFGLYGLRDLIAYAQLELDRAEAAMRELTPDDHAPQG